MTTLLLIRHGRTAANTAGILVGRSSGVQLDKTGVQQAADATRLSGVQLRAIVTSPLRRCRQTAQPLFAAQSNSLFAVEQAWWSADTANGLASRCELSKDKLWRTVSSNPQPCVFLVGNRWRKCQPGPLARPRLGRTR